jgi:hypothetical protein
MPDNKKKRSGKLEREMVNRRQKYEVAYEPKRKTPAKNAKKK